MIDPTETKTINGKTVRKYAGRGCPANGLTRPWLVQGVHGTRQANNGDLILKCGELYTHEGDKVEL